MEYMTQGYKDLIAWQVGIDLVEQIYLITEHSPSTEKFGLVSQLRRASVSIPSNIGEGYRRKTTPDLLNFFHIAYGSAAEVETQLYIALRLKFLSKEQYDDLNDILARLLRLLNGLIRSKQPSPH
jgi:four helix bundle protein